jgi:ABC-type sulfate/molybdate transport systems ATPase subunit
MAKYEPNVQFLDPDVAVELRRLADVLSNLTMDSVFLTQLNAEPAKYADGMVVYADGTNWNPGSGEGVYARYNSAWNKL